MPKEKDVFVRAIDGSIYRNPIIATPGGFVSFPVVPDEARRGGFDGLVHAWDRGAETQLLEEVLADALPPGAWDRVDLLGRGEVEVPSDPAPRRRMVALGGSFRLRGRISQPQHHDGIARYASRLRAETVLDPEPGAKARAAKG